MCRESCNPNKKNRNFRRRAASLRNTGKKQEPQIFPNYRADQFICGLCLLLASAELLCLKCLPVRDPEVSREEEKVEVLKNRS